eukprot:TRINITY_DN13444_c0_g1_i1.p1 TRINITY_DN13444_c0_g1~~TRINITY_DN13444_c0_g1_i1.p1  ORF type:complete len:189 (-),score=45.50 TRINITY_DN13444_c0_g1_i1:185-751(-)
MAHIIFLLTGWLCVSNGARVELKHAETLLDTDASDVEKAVAEGIRCCKKTGDKWTKTSGSMWSGCQKGWCTIMSRNVCSQIKDPSKCTASAEPETSLVQKAEVEIETEETDVEKAVTEGIRCCKKTGDKWTKTSGSMWSGCQKGWCTIMSRNVCSQIKDPSKCTASAEPETSLVQKAEVEIETEETHA